MYAVVLASMFLAPVFAQLAPEPLLPSTPAIAPLDLSAAGVESAAASSAPTYPAAPGYAPGPIVGVPDAASAPGFAQTVAGAEAAGVDTSASACYSSRCGETCTQAQSRISTSSGTTLPILLQIGTGSNAACSSSSQYIYTCCEQTCTTNTDCSSEDYCGSAPGSSSSTAAYCFSCNCTSGSPNPGVNNSRCKQECAVAYASSVAQDGASSASETNDPVACGKWGRFLPGQGSQTAACNAMRPATLLLANGEGSSDNAVGNTTNSSSCFPGAALVSTPEGSQSMSNLRIGDKVLTLTPSGQAVFEEIFMFSHRSQKTNAMFSTLTTATGHSITATAGHYIWAAKPGKAASIIRMADVQVGDDLLTSAMSKGDRELRSAVVRISTGLQQGLYNPHTASGSIVVNGVAATAFTNVLPPSTAVHAAVTLPFRLMSALLPSRTMAQAVNDAVLNMYFEPHAGPSMLRALVGASSKV